MARSEAEKSALRRARLARRNGTQLPSAEPPSNFPQITDEDRRKDVVDAMIQAGFVKTAANDRFMEFHLTGADVCARANVLTFLHRGRYDRGPTVVQYSYLYIGVGRDQELTLRRILDPEAHGVIADLRFLADAELPQVARLNRHRDLWLVQQRNMSPAEWAEALKSVCTKLAERCPAIASPGLGRAG